MGGPWTSWVVYILVLLTRLFFNPHTAYSDVGGTGTFTSFFKGKKVKKMSQNSRNQNFSYYFRMIEGSGSGPIPLTNGSGSGSRRPKNTWIRIRIRNTESYLRGFVTILRVVCAGHFGCKTTEYKSTDSPVLNVMYCVRVSLRTVKYS